MLKYPFNGVNNNIDIMDQEGVVVNYNEKEEDVYKKEYFKLLCFEDEIEIDSERIFFYPYSSEVPPHEWALGALDSVKNNLKQSNAFHIFILMTDPNIMLEEINMQNCKIKIPSGLITNFKNSPINNNVLPIKVILNILFFK